MVGNYSSVVLNREMILLPHPGTFGSIWRRVWSTQLGQAAAPGIQWVEAENAAQMSYSAQSSPLHKEMSQSKMSEVPRVTNTSQPVELEGKYPSFFAC